jgi:hypothetical protein
VDLSGGLKEPSNNLATSSGRKYKRIEKKEPTFTKKSKEEIPWTQKRNSVPNTP